MKKFGCFVTMILLVFCVFIFTGCTTKNVIKYYLNNDGELIVEFDNNTTENLGEWNSTIVSSLGSVGISATGYYVINGVQTEIRVVYQTVSISNDGYYIVNGIKTNISVEYDSVSISDDGYYVVNGIKTDIVATHYYTVSFETGFDAQVQSQRIEEGHRVSKPELERVGYSFDGWYCNGEKWIFNSDTVIGNITLTAHWTSNVYQVSFVNEKGDNPASINVEFDSNVTLPTPVDVDGYQFDGWYNNNELVESGKWKIANAVELSAKWAAKKYTVTLNPGDGSVSETTVEVTYDQNYSLPVATNDYGVFIGWFYNGIQITDSNGNSLFDWNYTTDIEVTTSWTIEISTVEDLQQLYTYPNGHFELKNNLDISLIEWTPVGTETKPFTGQIDGGNFIINGLKITQLQENQKYYGFIGYASSGKIFDLTFTNVNINLPKISNSIFVGSIIAKNENTTLENIIVSGNISIANHSSSYESYVGGLIGYSGTDDVKSCINSANITTKSVAGGIIGYKKATAEINHFVGNKNNGNITADIAGGLIGDGILCFAFECENNGTIIGTNYAGGIIGRSDNVSIVDKCLNKGNITTISDTNYLYEGAGGIVGAITIVDTEYFGVESSIKNSYNVGAIIGHYNAGGIIGAVANNNFTVENSYNSGNVDGNWYVGGIAGFNIGIIIRQCFNTGRITSDNLSAIFSFTLPSYTCTIIDCYYNCNTSSVGQIQGTKTTENYSATFYTEQLFWDNTVWDFHTDKLPTLKIESLFND